MQANKNETCDSYAVLYCTFLERYEASNFCPLATHNYPTEEQVSPRFLIKTMEYPFGTVITALFIVYKDVPLF